MIVSYIPGRVRLRSSALKDPENMQTILDMAKGFEGVISVTSSPATGSLLVLYDPEVISEDMLAQAAAAFAEQFPEEPQSACGLGITLPECLRGRRGENRMLLGAMGMTVGALAFGARAHAGTGGLFCLLAAKHIYKRRAQVF